MVHSGTFAFCGNLPLAKHSEADGSEMMVERESVLYPVFCHQNETGRVDRRKLVQISAFEVCPDVRHVLRFAFQRLQARDSAERIFPAQGNFPACIPVEKGKGLKNDRHRCAYRMPPGADPAPGFNGARVKRVAADGKRNPRAAVNEYRSVGSHSGLS